MDLPLTLEVKHANASLQILLPEVSEVPDPTPKCLTSRQIRSSPTDAGD